MNFSLQSLRTTVVSSAHYDAKPALLLTGANLADVINHFILKKKVLLQETIKLRVKKHPIRTSVKYNIICCSPKRVSVFLTKRIVEIA